MARWLRQSTSVEVPIGPFVDQTDGFTAETALTITQPDIRLKKNGAAWAQKNAAQTLTHEENGYYEVTLNATDTDTLGMLRLAVNEAGALPIFEDFLVVPANVWDSHFAADALQVDVAQWLGTSPAALAAGGLVQADVSVTSGIADSGTTTTMVDAARSEADTDYWKGQIITFTSGTIVGQSRLITGFNPATDTITFAPATTQAVGTNNYFIHHHGRVDLQSVLGSVINALISGRLDANAQVVSDKTGYTLTTGSEDAIVDKVRTETLPELSQAQPAATPTIGDALMLMYQALRNNGAATASERRIVNDAGTVICKAPLADDGVTFTQGKLVSGP
jgi:hypothetical protein